MTLPANLTDLPPTLDGRQAAELWGVGYETLLDAAREGTAPVQPIRIGRRLRWPTALVLATLGLEPPDPPGWPPDKENGAPGQEAPPTKTINDTSSIRRWGR